MSTRYVLGIMSGTSIDSVDYALCAVNDATIRLERLWKAGFPAPLQARLHAAARNACSSHELAQLHHDLGRFYARGAQAGPARPKAQLVGLHGQTVFHHRGRRAPATLQLGEPAYLVEALGLPVVSNFRVADLAAGGEGAPLATMFHRWVFARQGGHVCVNNLGGISNVTSLEWRQGREPRILAFDTGPANVLLDLAMRHFSQGRRTMDRHGAWAARGQPSEPLLGAWLKHPFFRRRPPKSTGRELFGEPFLKTALQQMRARRLTAHDALATLTEFTARSIALNYRRHLPSVPDTVVLAGGGAANRALAAGIRNAVQAWAPAVNVTTSDKLGWPRQSIEPAAFALLADLRWRRLPGNLPATTGARRAALLGQVSEP